MLHCVGRRRRESVWTRDCSVSQVTSQGRKTRGENWSTVLNGYAGAAIPRLQKLMDDAAKATEPTPNDTVLDENDRAVSTQLYWMMLMIRKGAARNIVFLAKLERQLTGLEATSRQTDRDPVRRATEVHAVFSFQRGTTERITAWEREIATYERDSGKILDDEIKVGVVLHSLPESQFKTNLLMRVDMLKKMDRLQRRSVCDFSCNCRWSVTADTDGRWSSGQGEIRQGWSKGAGKRNDQTQQGCSQVRKHGSHFCKLSSL